VLHDMEELTTDQVAEIMGLRSGTVAVRLHRGRLTLRREMSRLLGGESSIPTADTLKASETPARPTRTKRSVRCREMFTRISEYLDGTVNSPTCEQIEAHMHACPNCVAFLDDLRASIDRCRNLEIACDPAVTSRLRALFTQEFLRMLGRLPHESLTVRNRNQLLST